MKGFHVIRSLSWLVVALAAALLLASAAYAKGGAVIHHYAPPPLDAGSALPNPDYLPQVRSSGSGFDWADAGIGAAGGFGVIVAATGCAVVLRSRRRNLAPT
jgi:hypothetical protein